MRAVGILTRVAARRRCRTIHERRHALDEAHKVVVERVDVARLHTENGSGIGGSGPAKGSFARLAPSQFLVG
jgi:hypothetical protein